MPLATAKKARAFAKKFGRIRLTCLTCDASIDGIHQVPKDWADVQREQSLRSAISEWERGELPEHSRRYYAWWTHSGYCPECKEEYT